MDIMVHMSSTKRDYYEVLGIDRKTSTQDIAAAYRKLAIQFHPDSHPGDEEATLRFKEAAEAYEILGDNEKRATYDRYGHAGFAASGNAGGFRDVEDIFDAFGDIFGFGDFFGGGGRRRNRPRRGSDIRTEVTLDLEQAVTGTSQEIKFRRSKPCGDCSGSGAKAGAKPIVCGQCGGKGVVVQSAGILRVQTNCPTCRGSGRFISDPCSSCRGGGYQAEDVSINVDIPAGVDDGMQVRLSGQGEPSPHGGPAGDCYCVIRVREHNLFEREGQNLFLQIPISYTQAAFGASIEVPTLNGRHTLNVPAGTESGKLFTIRGQGAPSPHNHSRGDLYVRTFVEVPRKLGKREEEILRELAELEHTHVAPERKSFLEKIKAYFSAESSDVN